MKKVKITLDREACIGAAVCAAIAPLYWEMADDGKVDLIGGVKNVQSGKFELITEINEADLALLEDSARSCPVQVIEVLEA